MNFSKDYWRERAESLICSCVKQIDAGQFTLLRDRIAEELENINSMAYREGAAEVGEHLIAARAAILPAAVLPTNESKGQEP